MSSVRRAIIVVIIALAGAGFLTAKELAPICVTDVRNAALSNSAQNMGDIMLSDVPLFYGEEGFRQRVLERTGGERSPIGLVLSGGSARAIAHVGVLRYMEEIDIVPDYIVANSMGAIVGLLYSAGMSPDQIENLIENLDIGNMVSFTLPLRGGLLKADALAYLSQKVFKSRNLKIEDLEIPIIVVDEDLVTKRQVALCEGDFSQVFLSSFAIPVYFEAMEYRGHLLIDGGITNLAPIDLAYRYSDDVIVSTTFNMKDNLNLRNPLTALNSAIDIQKRREGVKEMTSHPDMVWIRCDVENSSFMDFGDMDSIISRGYETAKSMDPYLRKYTSAGPGVSGLDEKRAEISKSLSDTLSEFYMYGHVRQESLVSTLDFRHHSFLSDSRSYLIAPVLFGADYHLQWGNFDFGVTGGAVVNLSNAPQRNIRPAFGLDFSYYAFDFMRLSLSSSLFWQEGDMKPSLYVRQSIESRFKFFGEHFTFRMMENFEGYSAGKMMLLTLGMDGAYRPSGDLQMWSLEGTRLGVNYQLLKEKEERARSFIGIDADVRSDMPYSLFASLNNTFRFALDGKGNVPLFSRDGFKNNEWSNIQSEGDGCFLMTNRLLFGWKLPMKPTLAELFILNRGSIAYYLDLLWRDFIPDYSMGVQFEFFPSLLGMKELPLTIYCGYDSPSESLLWGITILTPMQ